MRHADEFGFDPVQPTVDLRRVMACLGEAVERVYAFETPEKLSEEGVDVHVGAARFEDPHTLAVTVFERGDRLLKAADPEASSVLRRVLE